MQEETVAMATKGPGEKLKRARESFGFTVWEAASQLYLPERIIRALEENDYHENLPARAFIRGYLRSYSKLLKLSPEETLSEFDALGIYKAPQEENIKNLSQPRVTIPIHRDKFWFGVVGGSLLGIIVLIIALTWLNTRQEKNEDLLNQALQEDEQLVKAGAITGAEKEEILASSSENQIQPIKPKIIDKTLVTPLNKSTAKENKQALLVTPAAMSANISVEEVVQNTTETENASPVIQLSFN